MKTLFIEIFIDYKSIHENEYQEDNYSCHWNKWELIRQATYKLLK